jgi:hypothetical protein
LPRRHLRKPRPVGTPVTIQCRSVKSTVFKTKQFTFKLKLLFTAFRSVIFGRLDLILVPWRLVSQMRIRMVLGLPDPDPDP